MKKIARFRKKKIDKCSNLRNLSNDKLEMGRLRLYFYLYIESSAFIPNFIVDVSG